uniref:Putative leucine-rich repeat protein, plant-type n=1 Tax=Helianthus annuus TaxID=4232 RepID=A0A251U541_HELAN
MKALSPVTLSSTSCLWFPFVLSLCTICFCNQNLDQASCIASERLVLIQLKNDLIDNANRLSSWVGNDCCSWSGVVCNNITGNVQEIHLRGPDDGFHGHCHGPYDTDDELEEASKQMLGGTISPSVTKLLQLMYFDISCNDFGFIPIPAFFGSFKNLRYLNISKSQFRGEIPHQLGNLSKLRFLDLHDVPLAGNIHSKSLKWLKDLQELQHLDMGGIDLARALDWFQGRVSTYENILSLVTTLDLSNNKFSGSIPNELVSLLGLRYLNLSENNLTGRIPNSFSNNGELESLDISINHLDGKIPSSLAALTALNFLNVSDNNLVGRIPTGPQLQTFDESSFNGNALCGVPLSACPQNTDDPRGTNNEHDESDGIDWILVICTLTGLVIGFWIMIAPLIVSKQWRNAYYHFLEGIWIKLRYFSLIALGGVSKLVMKFLAQLIKFNNLIYHNTSTINPKAFNKSRLLKLAAPLTKFNNLIDDQQGLPNGLGICFNKENKYEKAYNILLGNWDVCYIYVCNDLLCNLSLHI